MCCIQSMFSDHRIGLVAVESYADDDDDDGDGDGDDFGFDDFTR